MRLKAKGRPDAVDRRGRMANGPRHGAQAPVGCVLRRRFQCQPDRLGNLLVPDLPRRAGARLIIKAIEPLFGKAPTLFAHRVGHCAKARRNLLVLNPVTGQQHNVRPSRQALRRASAPDQASSSLCSAPSKRSLPRPCPSITFLHDGTLARFLVGLIGKVFSRGV
jgi:hypothetical protein